MEPSHFEMSSDGQIETEIDVDALLAELKEVREMLMWNAAIATVLLEQAGGLAEVSRADLEKIDLSKANAVVEYDAARDVYIMKGIYEDAV